MKKLSALLFVALCVLVSDAKAQSVYSAQSIGLPAFLTTSTNFVTPILIDCRKQDKVGFSFKVSSADSSSTTNVTFTACRSIDGINYDTNNAVTLTALVSGKTQFVTSTNNVTMNGNGYLFIITESIGANSAITNNSATYGIKF